MKVLAAGLLIAASVALGVATANGGAAAATHHTLGGVPHHGSPHRVAAPRNTSGFSCGSSCPSYETAINTFFTDVAAASGTSTNVYGVATQYCQGVATFPPTASCGASGTPIAYSSTFGGSYVDGSPFPANGCNDGVTYNAVHYVDKFCLTDLQLQSEIEKVIAANGWPIDSTRLFFIFTPATVGVCQYPGNTTKTGASNPCTTNVFCAYHHSTNQSNILYAVEPDDAQIPDGGCDTGQTPVGSGADATISTISHEQNESITDPFDDGWRAADGNENGDLCAYNFGTPLGGVSGFEYNQVINGTNYFLQQEYSNTDGGCLQQPGGAVSLVDPNTGAAGPLLYRGGSLMLTNTTYAIYWVPAAPTADSHVPPRITGAAKVGKKLKAFHGAWSNSPSFAYRWLRCSASGTSCKGIAKATGSSYLIAPGDTGHRIELRVTATNQGGHASATSVPTAKVRS